MQFTHPLLQLTHLCFLTLPVSVIFVRNLKKAMMYHSKKIFLFILLMNLSGLLKAQDMILDTRRNRFLINQKSDKPRLDVIVQSFTDYEKNEISKQAVMDTVTKPLFEKVADTEYNITASRMGEKLTFVIRDFEKLENGYDISFSYKEYVGPLSESTSQIAHYLLLGEKCAVTQNIPFGTKKVKIKILNSRQKTIYTLNVTFTYPKPELYYVDIMPHFDLINSIGDTATLRKFTKWISPEPHNFTSNEGGVPKKVVIADKDLNFGFKQAYYDGNFQLSSVTCKIDQFSWRGTELKTNPYTYIYYHLRKDIDRLNNGKHKLYARYGGGSTRVLEYEFEVKHHWFVSTWYFLSGMFKMFFMLLFFRPWLLIILLCIMAFLIYRTGQKRAREAARKTKLELQAIQAQLNPHFIFNAMGSIQGLINKNEIEKANVYLADFSKLLRNSLNNNEKEMIPLSEELRTLENYVRLEQLRFNFQYTFFVDENIETSNVEIPSLLIQPLIENAIKHGISGLNDNGLLNVSFIKAVNDLVIEVSDNGKGFDVNQKSAGQGIRLTRERIKLLNKSKNKIEMKIESGNGTIARLTLKHAF